MDAADMVGLFVFFLIYSFGYTLVLGLVGWSVLRVLGWWSWTAYALVGGVLAVLIVGVGDREGFELNNPFLYSFAAAGVAAALTFRSTYYRARSRDDAYAYET